MSRTHSRGRGKTPARLYTADEVRSLLLDAIESSGLSQRQWAISHGIAPGYVNQMLMGKTTTGPLVMRALGIDPTPRFMAPDGVKKPSFGPKPGLVFVWTPEGMQGFRVTAIRQTAKTYRVRAEEAIPFPGPRGTALPGAEFRLRKEFVKILTEASEERAEAQGKEFEADLGSSVA